MKKMLVVIKGKMMPVVTKGEPPSRMTHLTEDHSHLQYQTNPQKSQIGLTQLTLKGSWRLGFGSTIQAERSHKSGSRGKGRRANIVKLADKFKERVVIRSVKGFLVRTRAAVLMRAQILISRVQVIRSRGV